LDISADSDPVTLAAGPVALVLVAELPSGSGYFIGPNLLLTTSFIVLYSDGTPRKDIAVRSFDGQVFTDCEVIWSARKTDLRMALVHVNGRKDDGHEVNFGRFVRPGMRTCDAVAFTKPRTNDEVVARRITGTVDPGAYPGSDILEYLVARLPDSYRAFGGAGLLFERYFIGTIVEFDLTESAFFIRPINRLLEEASFRDCLKREIGYVPEVVDLTFSEPTVIDALKDVSKADPSNIQQVAAAQFLLSNSYYENVLVQARRSFNAAVVAATAGLIFFLAAVIFAVVTGKLAAPLVSSLAGGVVEVVAGLNFWLYGRTAIQLNSFHQRLERMQRFLVANSVTASLTGENREAALVDLIKVISASAVESTPPADG
jgi:hypothetical protein